MSCVLPRELLEQIVDAIATDAMLHRMDRNDHLRQLALASRAFLPRCQFYLYDTMDLMSPGLVKEYHQLSISSPHLLEHFRVLSIWQNIRLDDSQDNTNLVASLLLRLGSVSSIRQLSFVNFNHHELLLPNDDEQNIIHIWKILVENFAPRVEHLKFCCVDLITPEILFQFPRLKSLTLDSAEFSRTNQFTSSNPTMLPLTSLTIEDPLEDFTVPLDFISPLRCRLDHISWETSMHYGEYPLEELFRPHASHLRRVEILKCSKAQLDPESHSVPSLRTTHPWNLSNLPQLTHFTFHAILATDITQSYPATEPSQNYLPWLSSMLHDIQDAHPLKHLRILVSYLPGTTVHPDFPLLDSALTEARLPHLKTVEFSCPPNIRLQSTVWNFGHWKAFAGECMPLMAMNGKLSPGVQILPED
ncbi:hypothetical protein DL96DRAFT_470423 [Flagelloscypha sp. PMI_526]|nr:hypothetical protein DL96DRAFT_470423 [Flagelloscypha sp. PMI_526]